MLHGPLELVVRLLVGHWRNLTYTIAATTPTTATTTNTITPIARNRPSPSIARGSGPKKVRSVHCVKLLEKAAAQGGTPARLSSSPRRLAIRAATISAIPMPMTMRTRSLTIDTGEQSNDLVERPATPTVPRTEAAHDDSRAAPTRC